MNKIIVVIKTCVAVFLFYIFGYLLRLSFRQIPEWLFITFFIVLLLSLIFFVYKNRRDAIKAGDTDEDMPMYLQKSVYFYLIVGCFIGRFLSSSDFKATLIIDNGNNFPVEVTLPNGEKHIILQDSCIYASIMTGKNTLVINGDSIEVNVSSDGRWIYNIDNMNKYLETTVDYSNPDILYLDGNTKQLNSEKPLADVISETFFKVKTDFLFKAPETIIYSSKTNRNSNVRKTILLRMPKDNLKKIIIETYK